MEIDYPADDGHRRDETLWAFPIGIGIKYPIRRWLATRAEITDQIGIGNNGVNSQHDFTLTFALEWRLRRPPALLLALEPQPPYLVAIAQRWKAEGGGWKVEQSRMVCK